MVMAMNQFSDNKQILYPSASTQTKNFGAPPMFACQALTANILQEAAKTYALPDDMSAYFNSAIPDCNFQIDKLDALQLATNNDITFAVINVTHTLTDGKKEILTDLSKEQLSDSYLDGKNYPLHIFFNINNAMSAQEIAQDKLFNCARKNFIKPSDPICDYPHFCIGQLKPKDIGANYYSPNYMFADNYVLFYKDVDKGIGAKLFANAHDIIVQPTTNNEFEFVRVDDYYKAKQQLQLLS